MAIVYVLVFLQIFIVLLQLVIVGIGVFGIRKLCRRNSRRSMRKIKEAGLIREKE